MTRLLDSVRLFRHEGFAVVDGGHFDDLPAEMRRRRLFARSLFLDHANREVEKAGPWLIGLSQEPGALDGVADFVGDKPAVIYWRCAAGEAVLHHHLRTLAMVRIPEWATRGGSRPADASREMSLVFFRHYDPSVLGSLLPVLDASQFRRILGPAEEIGFHSEDYGGFRRVIADADWPAAPSGPLTIRPEQVERLSDRRLEASRERLLRFVREADPDGTAHKSDDEIRAEIVRTEPVARALGLSSERSLGLYMHLSDSLDPIAHRRACDYVRRGPKSPDANLADLFGGMLLLAGSDTKRGT